MQKTKQKQNIPKGWQRVKLAELGVMRGGLSGKNKTHFGHGKPFVTYMNVFSNPHLNRDNVNFVEIREGEKQNKLQYGDYLFTTSSETPKEVGMSSVVDFEPSELYLNSFCFIFRPEKDLIEPAFGGYMFRGSVFRKTIATHAKGSTRFNLSKKDFLDVDVVFPNSKSEQKKIAEILGAVDEEIQKTDEIISATEKLKKGLIQDLFTKNNDIKKLKIKDFSEVTSSKRVMVSDYVDEGIPFYRSTEIIKKSKNIPLANLLYISTEKYNFFKERFGAPEKGDILITAVGTIGDVYMVQNEVFYFKDGNTIWVRKIKDSILPEYLRMMLGSNFYREKLNNIAGGSSQKALTIQKLENVEVPVPSISEQKKLIEVISSVENKTKIYIQTKNNLDQLKKGLMQDLLSGNKRVKV